MTAETTTPSAPLPYLSKSEIRHQTAMSLAADLLDRALQLRTSEARTILFQICDSGLMESDELYQNSPTMSTRRQNPEQKQFRPDAFASSVEFDRGLLGNLVAARCQRLSDQDEIVMLWWLQQVSWREGGLERFAADFLAVNQHRIGTSSMHKFGMGKGQIYAAAQVRIIRGEFGCRNGAEAFPLLGERKDDSGLGALLCKSYAQEEADRAEERNFPSSYPAAHFACECKLPASILTEILQSAAVDPAATSLKAGLWNFPSLWEALNEWRQKEIAAVAATFVATQITRTVAEELDFALQSRSFILIEGREGVGKTEAAKAWCAQHPGQAIYVRLESGTDESTLYRSIARVLGTACSCGRKATEMRLRIQDALQPGQIMLVLDEAHFLWPQSERSSRSAPKRVDWLRTALVDFGVPVALISTPQYFSRACEKFLKGGWNANQIQRRLTHTVALPDAINLEEMKAVAKWYFPKARSADILRIADAAAMELGFLTVMSHLRKRVAFIAAKFPDKTESECIDLVLRGHPTAIVEPAPAAASADSKASAGRMQSPCKLPATPLPHRVTAPAILSTAHREQAMLTMR